MVVLAVLGVLLDPVVLVTTGMLTVLVGLMLLGVPVVAVMVVLAVLGVLLVPVVLVTTGVLTVLVGLVLLGVLVVPVVVVLLGVFGLPVLSTCVAAGI
jgi:hypothetical protein